MQESNNLCLLRVGGRVHLLPCNCKGWKAVKKKSQLARTQSPNAGTFTCRSEEALGSPPVGLNRRAMLQDVGGHVAQLCEREPVHRACNPGPRRGGDAESLVAEPLTELSRPKWLHVVGMHAEPEAPAAWASGCIGPWTCWCPQMFSHRDRRPRRRLVTVALCRPRGPLFDRLSMFRQKTTVDHDGRTESPRVDNAAGVGLVLPNSLFSQEVRRPDVAGAADS